METTTMGYIGLYRDWISLLRFGVRGIRVLGLGLGFSV